MFLKKNLQYVVFLLVIVYLFKKLPLQFVGNPRNAVYFSFLSIKYTRQVISADEPNGKYSICSPML